MPDRQTGSGSDMSGFRVTHVHFQVVCLESDSKGPAGIRQLSLGSSELIGFTHWFLSEKLLSC